LSTTPQINSACTARGVSYAQDLREASSHRVKISLTWCVISPYRLVRVPAPQPAYICSTDSLPPAQPLTHWRCFTVPFLTSTLFSFPLPSFRTRYLHRRMNLPQEALFTRFFVHHAWLRCREDLPLLFLSDRMNSKQIFLTLDQRRRRRINRFLSSSFSRAGHPPRHSVSIFECVFSRTLLRRALAFFLQTGRDPDCSPVVRFNEIFLFWGRGPLPSPRLCWNRL